MTFAASLLSHLQAVERAASDRSTHPLRPNVQNLSHTSPISYLFGLKGELLHSDAATYDRTGHYFNSPAT